MRRIRSSNTSVELAVRSLVHGMGYRFRLHDRKLPGTPDMVFASRRRVVFVHGCFWHQHPDPECLDSRLPKSNLDYWIPKLKRTQERDLANQQALSERGWNYLIVWECELKNKQTLGVRLAKFLG